MKPFKKEYEITATNSSGVVFSKTTRKSYIFALLKAHKLRKYTSTQGKVIISMAFPSYGKILYVKKGRSKL